MAMKTTIEAVKAICAADPSVNAAQVKAALAELNGEGPRAIMGEPVERMYSRQQVAELMGVSPKTVGFYAKRGRLKPIFSGARGLRAMGYSGESVRTLLSGN